MLFQVYLCVFCLLLYLMLSDLYHMCMRSEFYAVLAVMKQCNNRMLAEKWLKANVSSFLMVFNGSSNIYETGNPAAYRIFAALENSQNKELT